MHTSCMLKSGWFEHKKAHPVRYSISLSLSLSPSLSHSLAYKQDWSGQALHLTRVRMKASAEG